MENGRVLQFVKTSSHRGKRHTGGAKISDDFPDLRELFDID